MGQRQHHNHVFSGHHLSQSNTEATGGLVQQGCRSPSGNSSIAMNSGINKQIRCTCYIMMAWFRFITCAGSTPCQLMAWRYKAAGHPQAMPWTQQHKHMTYMFYVVNVRIWNQDDILNPSWSLWVTVSKEPLLSLLMPWHWQATSALSNMKHEYVTYGFYIITWISMMLKQHFVINIY